MADQRNRMNMNQRRGQDSKTRTVSGSSSSGYNRVDNSRSRRSANTYSTDEQQRRRQSQNRTRQGEQISHGQNPNRSVQSRQVQNRTSQRVQNQNRPNSNRVNQERRRQSEVVQNGISVRNKERLQQQRKIKRKQPAKVIPYKKPININLGMIIFGIIFIYVVICVVMSFTTKHIIGYEVQSGSLSTPNVYKGVAFREEHVVNANQAGYVNYFAREGEHVGVGSLVYTIDQSGKIAELVTIGNGELQLSDDDLYGVKTDIAIFQHNYSNKSFSDIYSFEFDLKGTSLKLNNYNLLNNVDSMANGEGGIVSFCNSPQSGVVVYSTDGYETLTPNTISENGLKKENYEKNQLTSNQLVSVNEPVYKLITSEDWSIVIQVDEERARQLEAEEYVNVKFLKNQYTSWAKVSIVRNGELVLAKLDFNNSMITFATDRFIDIEIDLDEEKGLKIPNSSIVEKEFYLIPKEYVQMTAKGELDGFLRETYGENGSISSELIKATIYSESETDYYVDTSTLRIGDYIIMPDSQNKYPISKVGTLIGVYNMDKGYADFKEITVLYSNEEYSIVKSNTQYGLSVYDHIVLDAASVQENDFLH